MSKPDGQMIITLDGPSGSGKSTVSHQLARHYGVPCLDTGAMYRTLALRGIQRGLNLDDDAALSDLAQTLKFRFGFEGAVPFVEVTEGRGSSQKIGKEIRTPEVSLAASRVAKLRNVRKVLVAEQQRIGALEGAVVEGRDAGTVIFPKAKFKFFMTASSEERARRRHKELQERLGPEAPGYDAVLREMIQRDEQDSKRAESPLKPALDAQILDTTGLDLGQVFQALVQKIDALRSQP